MNISPIVNSNQQPKTSEKHANVVPPTAVLQPNVSNFSLTVDPLFLRILTLATLYGSPLPTPRCCIAGLMFCTTPTKLQLTSNISIDKTPLTQLCMDKEHLLRHSFPGTHEGVHHPTLNPPAQHEHPRCLRIRPSAWPNWCGRPAGHDSDGEGTGASSETKFTYRKSNIVFLRVSSLLRTSMLPGDEP